MVFSCRELLFSTLFSCERPQATESLEKGCLSRISDATLGSFLAVFLGFQTWRLTLFWRGFGTSSSFRAMVFSCRQLIFSTLFYCEQPQAIESLEKWCFSRISDGTLGTFFGVVLELARHSEPWCFPARSCFFRRCFPASSRRQQNLVKKAVFLGLQTRR